ncbi:ANTAR domain-containing protein [Pseudarthrobacter sp. 1G09]|uniref:ANTAR domain-containing protein n=1 Tax=Pseudarthrobacter sp. 1G09 TaxID=3416178 RepID=UPI003CE7FFF4
MLVVDTGVSGGKVFADVAAHVQDLVLQSPDLVRLLDSLALYAVARLGNVGRELFCSISVSRPKKPTAAAASDTKARLLDQLELKYGQGPGDSAVSSAATMHVQDLREETRWPDYAAAATHQGAQSVLAMPLQLEGEDRGVLVLYSGQPQAFSADAVAMAEAFTKQAAKGLALTLRMAKLQDTKDGMTAAMQTRTVIDLATGAIMAQNRCSQDEAFKVLREASNSRNMKLRDVASLVVSSVAGGAKTFTYFDE